MICPNCGRKNGVFYQCLCTWSEMEAANERNRVEERLRREREQRTKRNILSPPQFTEEQDT